MRFDFTEREMFVLACTLSYASSNGDDVNEALLEADSSCGMVAVRVGNKVLDDEPVRDAEFRRLRDRIVTIGGEVQ